MFVIYKTAANEYPSLVSFLRVALYFTKWRGDCVFRAKSELHYKIYLQQYSNLQINHWHYRH